jgi:hypothetical protein
MLAIKNNQAEQVRGKAFPCPLCSIALSVELSCRQKPYCTCNVCGIQIFFRGKVAIKRLAVMLQGQEPLPPDNTLPSVAVELYNRLEKLKKKRSELELEQGIIFRNKDLDNVIAAVDAEIARAQEDLEKTRKALEKKK